MKRKPGNWLDFNANEREQETEMTQRGRNQRRREKKQQELFSPLQCCHAEQHDAYKPHRGAGRPTLMQSELTTGGTPPHGRKVMSNDVVF